MTQNLRLNTSHRITQYRRPVRIPRAAKVIAAIIAAPFLLAFLMGAGIGIYQGATHTDHRGPSAHTLEIMRNAEAASGKQCHAEWNEVQAPLAAKGAKGIDGYPLDGFEVICNP